VAAKGKSNKINSVVVFNKIYETPKGSLRIMIDISRYTDDLQRYFSHLCFARGIPNQDEIENITKFDKNYLAAKSQFTWMEQSDNDNTVLEFLKAQYRLWAHAAMVDAGVLAVTISSENEFDFNPEPYEVSDDSPLPGLPELPRPKRNLANPVERRLKQIMDLLASDINVMTQFQKDYESIADNVYKLTESGDIGTETDADGFQS